MSLHRTKAAIIGLLEANRVNEWVVTEKLGNTMKQKNNLIVLTKPRPQTGERYTSFLFFQIPVSFFLLCTKNYPTLKFVLFFFFFLLSFFS